jgi:PAS domain S-box-containing protein
MAALFAFTYTSYYFLQVRANFFYGLVYVVAVIFAIGAAWLGYGPGILACAIITAAMPEPLRILPSRGGIDYLVRFGLLLIVSLPISRVVNARRTRESSLLQFAQDFEEQARLQAGEASRAEAERREAEDRLRFVLDAAQIGYWDHNLGSNSTARSPKFDEIFGYREPLPHWNLDTLLQHVHPEDRPAVKAHLREALAGEQRHIEFRIVWPDYSVRWVWAHVRAHRDAAGTAVHVNGVIADITERIDSAARLLEQAQLLDLAHDAILSLDWNGTIRFWSCGAEQMYGCPREEALGKISHELLDTAFPEPLIDIEAKLLALGHWEGELLHRRRDGSRIRVNSRWALRRGPGGVPQGFLEIDTDITEKRRIEEQLRHTQKLESLGVLAGGVAHDFNNLLTGILGNASLALDATPAHHRNCDLLDEVIKAAQRAADLTRQLLAYAGKGRFVMRTLDLSELVREISELVQASIPKRVVLRLQLAEGLPGIDADAGQLQQIIMNLVINGAEAVGQEGGTVLVSTSMQHVDETYMATMINSGEQLRSGEYVALEVHDTGSGMDEGTLARIFDPFFTTKFAGRGLGLSAVLGIVRAHKGALKVYTKPGQGTTFKVLFPASSQAITRDDRSPDSDLEGTGSILVVDDEEIVRQTARHTLERYGYEVITAADGVAAVELFAGNPDRFLLVLLDLTMPVMTGEEALRRLQTISPKVRVLLSSGYNEVEAIQRFAGKGLAGFIQKPYTAAALAARVKSVLTRD